MKRNISCLLALLLALSFAQAETAEKYHLGDAVGDFALTTWDGQPVTLSGALAEKELVLLHFWAGWCGACEEEMPVLQAFWEEYGDRVAVIAVTISDQDTVEKLQTYCTRRGLTFPVAQDTAGLKQQYPVYGVPASIVIDGTGTMVALKEGAMASAADYAALVAPWLAAEDAAQQAVAVRWGDSPADLPGVQPGSLNEALNVPGGVIAFANPADGVTWPMLLAQDEAGRMGVTSTNALQDGSKSAVTAEFTAQAGDALAVAFSLAGEEVFDRFCIRVNGETVKVFTGKKPLTTWAWEIPADGAYQLELAYEKDDAGHAGEDAVFIDYAALLTGSEAQAALAANPACPVVGANTLTVADAQARQIVFDDPTFALMGLFGLADYYIVPGGRANLLATLTEAADPEGASIVSSYDDVSRSLAPMMTAAGYAFGTPVDSAAATGSTYTVVQLTPFDGAGVMDVRTVVLFASEADADAFVAQCQADGLNVRGWEVLTFSVDDGEAGIA